MKRFEDLPPLPPGATELLVALLITIWLGMRIRIFRRRQERRGPEDEPVRAWAWLRALAAKSWILPALVVVGVVLALGVVATFLLPR